MDVLALIDEVQAIARTGLHYATTPYDRERYERLLSLAVDEYVDRLALADDDVRARLAAEVGVITPKVGADAAIFDAQGRILCVLRTDDHRWGLVAGWVEPGEHPAQTVLREVREEVGLEVEIEGLAGIGYRSASPEAGPHATVSVVYRCRRLGGEIVVQPHEVVEARYWGVDEVPAWHLNHEDLARLAVAHRSRAG